MTDRLLERIETISGATGQAVHLVGHSFGGILARAAAGRRPDVVASVAVLGTPFRGLRVHPILRFAAAAVRAGVHAGRRASVRPNCLTLACDCPSVRALQQPLPAELPQLAVVSRHDGFGDWRYCLDPATTRVVHVTASHFGLVFNAAAYAALAEHLEDRGRRLAAR